MVEKKPKAQGFARIVEQMIIPFNSAEEFKQIYDIKDKKILLNPKDGKYAALLIFENGNVRVESVANTPKENLKKKKLGWNAFLETTLEIFFKISTGELSKIQVSKKWFGRKLKMRGIRVLLDFLKIISYLNKK
ncbi:MAG: hypothetical protein ACFFAN_06330 [Promethearchaeota archaeon]